MIIEVFIQNSKYYVEMMKIILESKVNPPESGQVHHIIPRCWFGHFQLDVDNSISNTVLLSYENHKKVHTLAYKCAKESWLKNKLACAAHLMGDKEADYVCSEETKKKMSEARKGRIPWNKGKKWSNPNGSIALKGRKLIFSEEHCKHISEAKKGKIIKISPEGLERKRQAAIKSNHNRVISLETRKKMSESLKGHIPWNKGLKMNMEEK